MKLNPKTWSGTLVIIFTVVALLAAFLVGAVAKAGEEPELAMLMLGIALASWVYPLWWSWRQPQLRDWPMWKLTIPGIYILIFSGIGYSLFTPMFSVIILLFYGIPYGVLIYSWIRSRKLQNETS